MLLAKLMNAPLKLQQAVALAIAAVLVVIPLITAIKFVSIISAQSRQIVEMREHAGKLSALASLKNEALRLEATSANDGASSLLLEADNLPIAKANLQSRIGALAQTHGVTVGSSGAVPDVEENGLLLIGLRADLSGSNDAIGRMLLEIETIRPPLLVREFTMRSEGAPLPDQEPTLSAGIKLYVALRHSSSKPVLEVQGISSDRSQFQ